MTLINQFNKLFQSNSKAALLEQSSICTLINIKYLAWSMFGLCKISAQRIVSFGLKISELIWYKHKHASLLGKYRFYLMSFYNFLFLLNLIFLNFMQEKRFFSLNFIVIKSNLTILVATVINALQNLAGYFSKFPIMRKRRYSAKWELFLKMGCKFSILECIRGKVCKAEQEKSISETRSSLVTSGRLFFFFLLSFFNLFFFLLYLIYTYTSIYTFFKERIYIIISKA